MERKDMFPGQDTLAYRILEMAAVCGELPASLIGRIPGSTSYKETVMTALRKGGWLKTCYNDRLRGYRLGRLAKAGLLDGSPERFSFYITGNADTNRIRSEAARRLRLHRAAEVYASMMNAGVEVFRDKKLRVFAPDGMEAGALDMGCPAYYSSREIKEIGIDAVKIRSSRMMGVLLAPSGIYAVYNNGMHMARWDYRAELRAKVFLEVVLCRQRLSAIYGGTEASGLLFGDSLELFCRILMDADGRSRCFFLLDRNYEHFYYLTNDHQGDVLLRLLCDTGRKAELDRILMQGLHEKDEGFVVENDAMDENGNPVLFGYFLDIPRINRFCTALQIQDRQGTIICFDFQKEALAGLCGRQVELSAISFEKFERRFFP